MKMGSMKKESKKEKLLNSFKSNLNKWVCTYCNSESGQPARITANLRADGYEFEKTNNGYSKQLYCPNCGKMRSHCKLLSENPTIDEKNRLNITQKQRKRVYDVLGKKDAFTGASITTSTPEIDHKTPFTARLEQDINIDNLTDEEIKEHFQILSRHNNLLKDKACKKCKMRGIRPEHFNVKYWYEGDGVYKGTCVGCGWHDGVKWREKLNEHFKNMS